MTSLCVRSLRGSATTPSLLQARRFHSSSLPSCSLSVSASSSSSSLLCVRGIASSFSSSSSSSVSLLPSLSSSGRQSQPRLSQQHHRSFHTHSQRHYRHLLRHRVLSPSSSLLLQRSHLVAPLTLAFTLTTSLHTSHLLHDTDSSSSSSSSSPSLVLPSLSSSTLSSSASSSSPLSSAFLLSGGVSGTLPSSSASSSTAASSPTATASSTSTPPIAGGGVGVVGGASFTTPTNSSLASTSFNTYHLVQSLVTAGLPEHAAVRMMEALLVAVDHSQNAASAMLATKPDVSVVKMELSEKMFNAQLKYDLQQKHFRELMKNELDALKNDHKMHAKTLESDLAAFRADLRMNQKTDLFALQQALNRLEKEVETEKTSYRSEQEKLENRLIKYALGFAASFGALALTAIRLLTQ